MKLTKIIAAALPMALLLTGCGKEAAPEIDMTGTAITVGDETVSAGMYSFYFDSFNSQMKNEDAAKEAATKQCGDNMTVVAVAKAMGIEFDEETQAEIDDYKQQVVDSYDGGYEDFLSESNMTDADIDKIISVSYYAEALEDKLEGSEPTDEERREYFKNNFRRAKHVLISVDDDTTDEDAKKQAEEVLERAKGGEDFDALIEEFSEDPGSLANPDGYVFTDNEMVQEFQDGTDSIGAGEFTLVKTTYGYHVIQRLALDETPELFEQFYSDAADKIDSAMENSRFRDQVYAWAEEHGIKTTTNDEVIDAIVKAASK